MPPQTKRRLLTRWFRRTAHAIEEVADGRFGVATSPPGAASDWTGDRDRETSTNAQMEGAADQPWPGNKRR
jgi:hypothetical protein